MLLLSNGVSTFGAVSLSIAMSHLCPNLPNFIFYAGTIRLGCLVAKKNYIKATSLMAQPTGFPKSIAPVAKP